MVAQTGVKIHGNIFKIVIDKTLPLLYNYFCACGEVSERFKEPHSKCGVSARSRGFESRPFRFARQFHIVLVRVVFSPHYAWNPYGDVPKWLKGLPWKGSRSLIAAQEFKSLHLRRTKNSGFLRKAAVFLYFDFASYRTPPYPVLRIISWPSSEWIKSIICCT